MSPKSAQVAQWVKSQLGGQVWWHTTVMVAFRRQRQVILVHTVRPSPDEATLRPSVIKGKKPS